MNKENWYALWVKSRHEFVISQELSRKGIDNFLPTMTRIRQWKDRRQVVDFPLFPGYLFVRVAPDPGEFLSVVKTRGSVCLVSLEPGHPTAIPPQEIDTLKVMLGSGASIDIFPALKDGVAVRVKRGPMRGAVGILSKREDQHMFLVTIDILGRSVGMKIYAEDVEQA